MKTKLSELKQIKFLSYIYKINKITPPKNLLNNKWDWGGVNSYTNQIDINIENEQAERVLIHEVTHIISDSFVCNLSEEQVDKMSEGFYHFLIDNNLLKSK